MRRYLALVALLALSAPAYAGELAAYQAGSIRLGSIHGVTYYTESDGSFRVVTTLADGEAGPAIRFEAILTDQQRLTISVAGKPGEPSRAVEISRAADRLVVSSPHEATGEDRVCVPRKLRVSREPDKSRAPTRSRFMQTVIPGLYASAPESLPFGRSLQDRAFLLVRERGNLLVYSSGTVAADAEAIEDLGGISRQYLNHWHEASFGIDQVAKTFEAELVCHENERASVSTKGKVGATFSQRHLLDDDFEVIPTPGHTSGATAFLWDSGQHRCLFTGDSIYLREGEWVAAVLAGSSDRDAYIRSLELIRDLEFDVLMPWIATAGQAFHAVTDRANARRRIDTIIARLRRGDDH